MASIGHTAYPRFKRVTSARELETGSPSCARKSSVCGRPNTRAVRRVPAGSAAMIESLRQQLHVYREEIARLRAENDELNDRLARRLGEERAAAMTRRS